VGGFVGWSPQPEVQKHDTVVGRRMTNEQAQFFDKNGYIVISDVISPEALASLRAAADRVEADTQADWLSRKDDPNRSKSYGFGPTAHVIEPVIDRDDAFVDVLENPQTIGIV